MRPVIRSTSDAERWVGHALRQSELNQRWRPVSNVVYSATPSTTRTIQVADDSVPAWSSGNPIKYRIGGTVYYGIISNATAGNNLIAVYGAPLSGDIEAMWVGAPELVRVEHFNIPGAYGTSANAPLVETHNADLREWHGSPSRVVHVRMRHKTAAGTTNPVVNFAAYTSSWRMIGTASSGSGYSMTTNWIDFLVDTDTSNYRVVNGDRIDFYTTSARVGTDPAGFVGHAVFVLE